MKYVQMERSLRGACTAILLLSGVALGESAPTAGNPDTNASDRNYDTNQPNSVPGGLRKAEDGSNRALNKVDRGVHKGIRKTKRGAKKAKAKTNKTMDEMSEPAHEPAR